ncbi:monooxygenase 1-like [Cynara cardunculus var. scolymus]|nr:monooxygenase 1-like [Cynara cardunculus var. scolymus]
MDVDDEVVIIGAGICGLATALALHKKGIKSVVMERSESLRNTTGSAIGIRQNGWRALDQLGVAETLRHTAIAIQRERIVSLADGKVEEIPMKGETRCLRRKDLIDTLYDALPPATVKFGCQLESIKLDQITTKPVLRFIDGSSIIAKVVIGCDGGKSIVADFLNLKPTKMFSICGVRGLSNYRDGHSFAHEFLRIRKDNKLVGRLPIDEHLVYWFCAHPYVPGDERNWEDPEEIRRSTLDLLSDYPKEIQEMIEITDVKTLSFSHLRYRAPWDLLMGTFCKGTVTIAGDAMHVMGPFLGQGGSAGLEDAIVLARNLAQMGSIHVESRRKVTVQGVEEAFNLYVKQRKMRVIRLSLQTYLTGMLLGASSHLKKLLCIVLLFLLFRNPSGHIDYDCGCL